jgi:ubiquinone/menaquinone biosynthesis C-methylase UbiE
VTPSIFTTDPPDFWELSYRAGDNVEHWDPPRVPGELVAAVADGLVRSGQTALDIGCGAGCEAVFLAAEGVHVIGVDTSRAALDLAGKRASDAGVEVDWRLGDATDLPVEAESVDFVLDRGCFHVITRRRRPLYAAEVARVLRPHGILFLRGAREDDEEAGLIGFDRDEIERLFALHSLECGPLSPLQIEARAGDLDGWNVVLSRGATRSRRE